MTSYVIAFEGKAFDPNGRVTLTPEETAHHNKLLNLAEVQAWDAKPDHFIAYVVKNDAGQWEITTWLGTRIGRVIVRNTFQGNIGRITSIRALGTNGAIYYGRYGADWSQAIRLRKAKGSKS